MSKSEQIMESNSVFFRTRDCYPPSNLQLLIGHFSFEVRQLLDVVKNKEASEILQSFSTKFDRKMELRLEDLTPNELMEKSR